MASWLKKFSRHGDKQLSEQMQRHASLKKRFNKKTFIQDADYVAFDTELTGLNPSQDSILSIGAIKLHGGRILPAHSFYKLVKPEAEINYESVVIHEITPSELEEADALADVLEQFIDFIGDAILIGHYVHIDATFVSRGLKKHFGISLKSPTLDTGALHDWLHDNDSNFARHYGGMTTKTDLFALAKKYGIPAEKSHNSFNDAFLTAQLFQRFLCFLPECGIQTVKEILTIGKL